MEQALRVLADFQWWIYGVLGLILLFYLWRALVARRDSVRSIFKLEQEQARGRYARSLAVAALVILVMAAVFVLANLGLPTLTPPPVVQIPTVTTGPLVAPTLTATSAPPTITPTASATPERPTRPVRPTATLEVTATVTLPVQSPACPNPNVQLTSPGTNQVVSGNFPVRGIANIASFQYYKVEIAPGPNPQDHEWTVVGQLHSTPVAGGVLETFNSDAYPVGTYTLQLVVVDQTGNYPEPCRVTVSVQR
jgi:hypothetical protein